MSRDKELYEAQRWLETASEDLDAARALLEKDKFSHACFFAQQAGEKALKALGVILFKNLFQNFQIQQFGAGC